VHVCANCFSYVYLLERPDICAAVRSREEANNAWHRHVAPILFDQARNGFPTPTNLPELVRWLEVERERQALIARTLVLELGAELEYEPPTAVCWVLAACTGRLAA